MEWVYLVHSSLFSSMVQDWNTPIDTYNLLNKEFKFTFDPCPNNPKFDGLKIEWGSSNFINPPYNSQKEWVLKAISESKKNKTSVLLLPSRTDTKLFHEYILPNFEIRFIKGRLCFNDCGNSAPFPSMVIIIKGQYEKTIIR